MKNKILILLALLCTAGWISSYARDSKVQEYYNMRVQCGESDYVYQYLYNAHTEYLRTLKSTSSSAASKQTAASGLAEMFPCLLDGVVYYTNVNNSAQALKFAEAYIDLSLNEALRGYQLPTSGNYAQIAYFAASNNYNTRNWDKAVKYLDAYIRSGDTKYVRDAYNFAAKAAINMGQKPYAQQVIKTGLTFFPEDLGMLTTAINLFSELKNDDATLQTYVNQALRQRPNDEGLINIQAQLYERTQNYDGAITYYTKLRALKPRNSDITKHLALNYYNAGVACYNNGSQGPAKAKQYFTSATSLLNEVLANEPMAINYAYALANSYSVLGDQANLVRVNDRIEQLGQQPVAANVTPGYMGYNNQTISLQNNPGLPSLAQNTQGLPAPNYNQNSNVTYIQAGVSGNYNAPVVAAAPPQPSYGNAQYPPQPQPQQYPQPQQPQPQQSATQLAAATAATPAAKPQPAALKKKLADVDQNIPSVGRNNAKTYALIIANEDYTKVKKVDNAKNDGRIFAEYCRKTLGVPDNQIDTVFNATFGQILDEIDYIGEVAKACKGDLNLIVYYCGHGIPDEQTKTGYILPIDSNGKNLRSCIPLNRIYKKLADFGCNNTLVFLDACFSGSSQDGDVLFAARGVAIPVDESEIEGKVLVFSAATGSQTAWSYDEKNHGMFTYYLLKKLQDSRGAVNLGNLAQYVEDEVGKSSVLINRKAQNPTVTVGSGYSGDEWKQMSLLPALK